MILIIPTTWPYGTIKPISLLDGMRCFHIYSGTTASNLQKVGVPLVYVHPQDFAVMHASHKGPTGAIMHPVPSQITAQLPSGWTG